RGFEEVERLGFDQEAEDEAKAAETDQGGIEEHVVADQLGAEFGDDRGGEHGTRGALKPDGALGGKDEVDSHDVSLHRAETESRAVGSGGYRAGDRLTIACAGGFQGKRTVELGSEDGIHLFHPGPALEVNEVRRIGSVAGLDGGRTDRKI